MSMIVPSFFTATAYRSVFGLPFAHKCLSNRRHPHFFIYVVAANAISLKKTFPWQLLPPYVLPDFKFRVEIFLEDVDPTKSFQHKNFFNVNFIERKFPDL